MRGKCLLCNRRIRFWQELFCGLFGAPLCARCAIRGEGERE